MFFSFFLLLKPLHFDLWKIRAEKAQTQETKPGLFLHLDNLTKEQF